MGDRNIEVEAVVGAPAERVWRAWTSPDHLARWFVDEAKGRIGKDRKVTWIWKEFGLEVEYEVVEVEAGRRIVLRAAAPGGGTHTVETTFLESAPGRTTIRVVQSGFEPAPEGDDDAEAARSGWALATAVLGEYVENHWNEKRNGLLAMRPTRLSTDDLRHLLRSESGLSRWLTRSGSVGKEGDPVRLRLRRGGELTGRVLRRTRDEAAITWEEIGGVLELKGFPGAGGRVAALRVTCWGDPPASLERERESLSGAMDRLTGLQPA